MGSLNLDTNWGLVAQKYFQFQFKSGPNNEQSNSLRGNMNCFLLEDPFKNILFLASEHPSKKLELFGKWH